jgi:hypothetical protein
VFKLIETRMHLVPIKDTTWPAGLAVRVVFALEYVANPLKVDKGYLEPVYNFQKIGFTHKQLVFNTMVTLATNEINRRAAS